MSTPTRKQILIAGLGPYGPYGGAAAKSSVPLVQADMAKAAELGFDCTELYCDPKDVEGSLAKVREVLDEKDWDGFNIGFGVRGIKENTELFEGAVNAAMEVVERRPGMRMCFSTSPHGIVEALVRVWGK